MAVLVAAGGLTVGCTRYPVGSPVHELTPGLLSVKLTSVTQSLEPYNPQFSNHGIATEHIKFSVRSTDGSYVPKSFYCSAKVFHSGRQVGAMTTSDAAPSGDRQVNEAVDVQLSGEDFATKPSDVHMVCSA
jgi:hypothetical protein